jgi:DNA-binding NtrC family response regulator
MSSRSGKSARARLFGDGVAMVELRDLAQRLADFPFPVLILGETGTGKYELALWMHEHSLRSQEPFIDVHCANLSESLFESVLFGHERGAFTDAREQRAGRIEIAGRGTVMFDEIDCLDDVLQAKLLRFADRRTYERLGGRTTLQSDAALIFTTNQDLWEMQGEGSFRADLLSRMTWAVLRIPPLRERAEDIPLLAGMFLEEGRRRFDIPRLQWAPEALHMLKTYDWPGNVRELQSVAYFLAFVHSGDAITEDEVDRALDGRRGAGTPDKPVTLSGARNEFERRLIADALRQTDGNRVHAAKLLRIGRRTLQGKIAKYGL